ncbi:MAG: PIN domain-containing protein [Janthinobacterium sp.]|jgi:hypothetical protein
MHKILIDTCTWLDLAKDPDQQVMLTIIEELIGVGELGLIVPETVIHEIDRNKARVVTETGKSLSGILKRAKEAVNKLGDEDSKTAVLAQLDNIDFKIPGLGDLAASSISRIESLLKGGVIIETSPDIKLRAAQRAINKQAPFHRGKNSFNDAILIETYHDCVMNEGVGDVTFAFVSHNVTDFSHPFGNNKSPHPDFASYFSEPKSSYFIKLAEAIQQIDPELVSDLMLDHEWLEEPRSLSDIIESVTELTDKVWYNRHQNLRYRIDMGQIKVVTKYKGNKYDSDVILKDIFIGAKNAAKSMERNYKKKNLGPWDDFEWGMINGKLSALRWVLGEDWDSLDT